MPASITLNIRLGPLVSLKIMGESCHELAHALEGYDHLNTRLNALCSDLAERIYPEGMEEESEQEQDAEGREEHHQHGEERE